MTTFRRATCGLAAVLALSCATPALAQKVSQYFGDKLPCGNTVTNKLAQLGLDKAQIADTMSEEEWSNSQQTDVFQGWTVWIKPKSCKAGQLVVKLTSMCVLESVYTTGGCSVKGAPAE